MSVTHPKGFVAAGVAAGLKTSGNKDVALVVNTGPRDTAAAVFTSNRIQAAPITWSKQAIADGQVRAVVLNSGARTHAPALKGLLTLTTPLNT